MRMMPFRNVGLWEVGFWSAETFHTSAELDVHTEVFSEQVAFISDTIGTTTMKLGQWVVYDETCMWRWPWPKGQGQVTEDLKN